MAKQIFQIPLVFLLLILPVAPLLSQRFACKTQALAALKPIPKLKYKCNENLSDFEDAVLTQPNRKKAINLFTKTLEKFAANADWWKSSVEDLKICDFRKKAGVLSETEMQEYKGGEYSFKLFGNQQFRIIVAADPCYQTGFNGANFFLLNRFNGKVFAAEIVDGFFTRADLPLVANFAQNGNEPIIEISTTGGGISPSIINYYFTIDPKTHRAIPKNLFQDDDKKLSNRIDSMMLMEDAEEYGLPPKTEVLEIIKNGRLAKSFDIAIFTGETVGEENHEKFERLTLRWNGKFYQ